MTSRGTSTRFELSSANCDPSYSAGIRSGSSARTDLATSTTAFSVYSVSFARACRKANSKATYLPSCTIISASTRNLLDPAISLVGSTAGTGVTHSPVINNYRREAGTSIRECTSRSVYAGLHILSEMAQFDLLEAARALLIENGVSGPVCWVHDGEDEWVFIVDTHGVAGMNEERATRDLIRLLGVKVSVTTDGPGWAEQGTPL